MPRNPQFTKHVHKRVHGGYRASPTRAAMIPNGFSGFTAVIEDALDNAIPPTTDINEKKPLNRRLSFSRADVFCPPQWNLATLHNDKSFLDSVGLEDDPFWSPPASPTTRLPTNIVSQSKASQDKSEDSTDVTTLQQHLEDVVPYSQLSSPDCRANPNDTDFVAPGQNSHSPRPVYETSSDVDDEDAPDNAVIFGGIERWDEETKACVSPFILQNNFSHHTAFHSCPTSPDPVPDWAFAAPVDYLEASCDAGLAEYFDVETGVLLNPTIDDRSSASSSPGSSHLEINTDDKYTKPLARQVPRLIHYETSSEIGEAEHYGNAEVLISLASGKPLSNLEVLATLVPGNSPSDNVEALAILDLDNATSKECFFNAAFPTHADSGSHKVNEHNVVTSLDNQGRRPTCYETSSDIGEPEHYENTSAIIAIAAVNKHIGQKFDINMGRTVKSQSASPDHQMAIFIHAGAGYHSTQNEHVHLAMCSMAASEAMQVLKAGGTAVDAVVAAIKVLEDQEVTNAGYGSNLTIDGQVECDATIVDHYGRSGACGAVSHIKNPISLAKLILSTSTQTLSLRRVPPNFLVGEGAVLFAKEHGMATVNNSALVSRNANDRYQKWRADLARGEIASGASSPLTPPNEQSATEAENRDQDQGECQLTPRTKAQKGLLRDHTSALLTGTWNEGQPDSPDSVCHGVNGNNVHTSSTKTRSPLAGSSNVSKRKYSASASRKSDLSLNGSSVKRVRSLKDEEFHMADATEEATSLDGSSGDHDTTDLDSDLTSIERPSQAPTPRLDVTEITAGPIDDEYDLITDTMGAIAIDSLGNIAAGSSSGGIGMKHMGRTGPAALVGVGTAVVPCDRGDPEKKRTAAVTSGTGEHMATTMAAQKCAERLYHCTRRGTHGRDVRDYDTCAVMKSFVENDFTGHPGVCNMPSARAIGVMGVEVTVSGIYLHWAHNTDSFALASMGEGDDEAATVMSRLANGQGVTVGARKVSTPHRRS